MDQHIRCAWARTPLSIAYHDAEWGVPVHDDRILFEFLTLEAGCNVPMYRTNLPCTAAGTFRGPLVVTMRPLTPAQAIEVVVITSRFPQAHGAPIHFGDPAAIGISDLTRPDFGDPVTIRAGEIPVFWACGVTPQAVLMEVKTELAITHSPGCMFVTDRLAEDKG